MEDISKQRKWYKKKRYMLPLGFLGLAVVTSLSSSPATPQANVKSATESVQTRPTQKTAPLPTAPVTTAELEQLLNAPTPPAAQPSAPETKVAPPPVQQAAPKPVPVANPPTYYTNVNGNKVQSPTKADSKPANASAKCRDGSYSFSQNRRGTCSHHGGVAVWY